MAKLPHLPLWTVTIHNISQKKKTLVAVGAADEGNILTGTMTNRQESIEMLRTNSTAQSTCGAIHLRAIMVDRIQRSDHSFGSGSTVYVYTDNSGDTRYSTAMPWDRANVARAMEKYTSREGDEYVFDGGYYVESISGGIARLRLDSRVMCSVLTGCIGHELNGEGLIAVPGQHQFPSRTIAGEGGIKMILTKIVEDGVERRNVFISDFDDDLDARGVFALIDGLEGLRTDLVAEVDAMRGAVE